MKKCSPEALAGLQVASDPDTDPASDCDSFTARIFMIGSGYTINNGFEYTVDCHTAHVDCEFQLLKKLDRRTGKLIEDSPDSIKSGDLALVKMLPSESMVVEKFSDYAPLGPGIARDENLPIGLGIVTVVEETN